MDSWSRELDLLPLDQHFGQMLMVEAVVARGGEHHHLLSN